jgi:hypothetical protein
MIHLRVVPSWSRSEGMSSEPFLAQFCTIASRAAS